MSAGYACTCSPASRAGWRVSQRQCNHSAFNGYRRTWSAWSAIVCLRCRSTWRTKARYVATLPDLTDAERNAR